MQICVFQSRVLSVCLVDTTGSDDIHVNDTLKEDGFAESASDEELTASANSVPRQPSPKRELFLDSSPQRPMATVEAVQRPLASAVSISAMIYSCGSRHHPFVF